MDCSPATGKSGDRFCYILHFRQIGVPVDGLERRVLKGKDPVCVAIMH